MTTAPLEAPTPPSKGPIETRNDFTWQSPDGLTLAGKEWPAREGSDNSRIPVLCLPGLSRNTRDFEDVARYLQSRGHRVIALDYRGRGASDWDEDWRNYALPVEEKDIDAAIEMLGLERFALLGTSRGGLHALVMGARYPATRMAAVIFNDVGPHIEMRAIHRIAATLGHHMETRSLQDVADNLHRTLGRQFPAFDTADWLKLAGQLASERESGFGMDYDPALAHQLASLDDAAPAPDLWPLYETLLDRPVLILHGEHSDLLSTETCQRMTDLHPDASVRTIPGQGHAPVLWDEATHKTIAEFLQKA
ncbi:alpha/beta fold hydrolase [Labrenzia sp. VG12]|uniref:alpha/beta fold hydrolase n=1 Tax=Labrenzia sp. VG12 TaxID=2021862 RepID=UPI000B8C5470|nr:alpha/beta fold hydrolase [Labrenzia sp. VG12]ASP32165.1 alpha/beta hydrolase [Labrenzia sp. VG12]